MNNFDAKKIKDEVVEWIRNWFEENGKGCNAVVGISGGKDSSVVAALCVEALGKERVIGVLMPNGLQSDIEFAYKLVDTLKIDYTVCNIGDAIKELFYCVEHAENGDEIEVKLTEQATTNLPARVRMATLYAVSQSCNGRVANTCNLSEDWVGYSTRYGDSVGDFSPLSNLTTDEVIEIGRACGLPEELVAKVPSDGLCGKTDEENLGFTYKQLNDYIRTGVCEDAKIKGTIDKKHIQNLFKLKPMPSFDPGIDRGLGQTIKTRNEAADIAELFEEVLDRYDISVPCPEDEDLDGEDDERARLYGTTYFDLVDDIENRLIEILNEQHEGARVISYRFA